MPRPFPLPAPVYLEPASACVSLFSTLSPPNLRSFFRLPVQLPGWALRSTVFIGRGLGTISGRLFYSRSQIFIAQGREDTDNYAEFIFPTYSGSASSVLTHVHVVTAVSHACSRARSAHVLRSTVSLRLGGVEAAADGVHGSRFRGGRKKQRVDVESVPVSFSIPPTPGGDPLCSWKFWLKGTATVAALAHALLAMRAACAPAFRRIGAARRPALALRVA